MRVCLCPSQLTFSAPKQSYQWTEELYIKRHFFKIVSMKYMTWISNHHQLKRRSPFLKQNGSFQDLFF